MKVKDLAKKKTVIIDKNQKYKDVINTHFQKQKIKLV
jgi:hypothetical protein